MLNGEDILKKYFAQAGGKQIVAHQIESFNQFIEYDIPDIIHRANPIKIRGSPETPIGISRMAAAAATANSAAVAAESVLGNMGGGNVGAVDVGGGARYEYEVTIKNKTNKS